jgi:hypothetical protein
LRQDDLINILTGSFTLLFLDALAVTILAEIACGIALRLGGGRRGLAYLEKIKWDYFVLGMIFASLFTLPYIWFVFYDFIKDRTTFAVVAELWAWLAEAVFYRYFFRIGFGRSLVFSFLLNLFSFAVGLLLFR